MGNDWVGKVPGGGAFREWDRTESLEYKIRKALGFIWY